MQAKGIDVLRLIFPDILGITRSKDLLVSQLERAKSPAFCQGVWVTTTRGGVLDGNDIMSDGLPDLTTTLDPATLTMMPWEPGVAYMVCRRVQPRREPERDRTTLGAASRDRAVPGTRPHADRRS